MVKNSQSEKADAGPSPKLLIKPVQQSDLSDFARCLTAASLPVSDLQLPGRRFFSFCNGSGAVLGYGGYELHGYDALLRAIVVEYSYRRLGIGRQIVSELRNRVRAEGARAAFLLTTNAQAFFAGMGFAVINRENAPALILKTEQAMILCPATASLLWQPLVDGVSSFNSPRSAG